MNRGYVNLKGLAMIFAGQENQFIILQKQGYIYIYLKKKNPHKFAEIIKKKRAFGIKVSFLRALYRGVASPDCPGGGQSW